MSHAPRLKNPYAKPASSYTIPQITPLGDLYSDLAAHFNH
jgi:hypothetical protein